MAGCIAIGSRAAAEPLARFFVLHKPMDMQLHCVIIKRLQLKRKKLFFPYKRLRRSTCSISQGTEVTIVTERVSLRLESVSAVDHVL